MMHLYIFVYIEHTVSRFLAMYPHDPSSLGDNSVIAGLGEAGCRNNVESFYRFQGHWSQFPVPADVNLEFFSNIIGKVELNDKRSRDIRQKILYWLHFTITYLYWVVIIWKSSVSRETKRQAREIFMLYVTITCLSLFLFVNRTTASTLLVKFTKIHINTSRYTLYGEAA